MMMKVGVCALASSVRPGRVEAEKGACETRSRIEEAKMVRE